MTKYLTLVMADGARLCLPCGINEREVTTIFDGCPDSLQWHVVGIQAEDFAGPDNERCAHCGEDCEVSALVGTLQATGSV